MQESDPRNVALFVEQRLRIQQDDLLCGQVSKVKFITSSITLLESTRVLQINNLRPIQELLPRLHVQTHLHLNQVIPLNHSPISTQTHQRLGTPRNQAQLIPQSLSSQTINSQAATQANQVHHGHRQE